MKEFSAAQIEEALRFMQKGQHIGKIIVNIPESVEELPLETPRHNMRLYSDKAYLFVGGLGGLGRSVSNFLVERGARHIVFFSRSAGSLSSSDPFFKELAAQGCSVQAISGSVSECGDVERAVNAIGMPIGGVLQASMVLSVSRYIPFLGTVYSLTSTYRMPHWWTCPSSSGKTPRYLKSRGRGTCTTSSKSVARA